MSPRYRLVPRPGFEWGAVNWGGPDQPRTEFCSYCDAPLDDECVPLILWNEEGWCAEFCQRCQEIWWFPRAAGNSSRQ